MKESFQKYGLFYLFIFLVIVLILILAYLNDSKSKSLSFYMLDIGQGANVLFDGDVEAETSYTISVNSVMPDIFTISITTDAELYQHIGSSTCGCGQVSHYSITSSDGNSNSFFKTTFQVRCDIGKHLCRFIDKLVPAIIYRTLGKIYFQAYTTDAFNTTPGPIK
jgi:hypothetical protein